MGLGYIDVVDEVVGTSGPLGALRLGGFRMMVGLGGATDRRFAAWADTGSNTAKAVAIIRIDLTTPGPLTNRGYPCHTVAGHI